MKHPFFVFLTLAVFTIHTESAETWRGLVVNPENRCSPYKASEYRYPQSVEPKIVESMGGRIYGPYTGRCFTTIRHTDIEHVVARSEAHDSGLCSADPGTKQRFARDLLNLTLANPRVNRHQKRAHDAAEWMPARNRCWFANRIVEVRLKYGLTIDRREAEALERVLSVCESTEMVIGECAESVPAPLTRQPNPPSTVDALALWDDNGNGRITCAEARRHGIAPVPRGHPAYRFMNDRDGDGVVCE